MTPVHPQTLPAPDAAEPYPSLRAAFFTLFMLCLAMVISLLDRHLLGLLIEPVRADLQISDTQIALLQGFAFVVFYLAAGLIFGVLIDRYSRRNIIAGCLAGWSVMTMMCGLAQNFWQLFAARSGVGVGEAGLHPAAFSKLCDLFRPEHRGRAFGVLGWAGNLGAAASLLGGAALYAWLSGLGPLFGDIPVWQMTFIAAGVPGIVLALLFLTVKEPARRGLAGNIDVRAASRQESIGRYLVANWRLTVPLLACFALVEFTCYAMLSFGAAYYMRIFEVPLVEAGTLMGLIVLIGGLGSLASGFLGDYWSRAGVRGGRLQAAIWAGLIGVPALLVWSLSSDKWLSFAAGALSWAALSLSGTQGPLIITELVPNALRGRMGAVYVFSKTGSAAILGPLAVALVTERLIGDPMMVNLSLAIVAPTALTISGLLAWSQLGRYATTRARLDTQLAAAAPISAQAPVSGERA